jgi:DNA-binding response OmpR family regulator
MSDGDSNDAGSTAGRIPVLRVRFSSFDDFLVEYGDHLRGGHLVLPQATLEPGRHVRIKLELPDDAVLYLTGTTLSAEDSPGRGGLGVRLNPLTPDQRDALERCLARAVQQGGPPVTNTPTAAGLNLLLVDDSVTIRIELGDALRERGLRVRVAENGLAAIAQALKKPPDIILSDVEMPVMDGWTLLRMIRSRKQLAHLPFVFFTRLTDDLSRLQGYRMGVEDYLGKDMRPDEIVARLEGVMARWSSARRVESGQGMRGDLEHVRLASLLSFLEQERRTGHLRLEDGRESAVVRIVEGAVVDVHGLSRHANVNERVYTLLDWGNGEFEFIPSPPGEPSDAERATMEPRSITYLLMEHARRQDEAQA